MDPMDWVHSWDDYEIMMYIDKNDAGEDRIYMQGSRVIREEGMFELELLYDREIGRPNPEIIKGDNEEMWQEKQLRWFLDSHPDLVDKEKAYLHSL